MFRETFVLALTVLAPLVVQAEELQPRLLIHRAPTSGLNWGGWVVAPNLFTENRKAFAVVGPAWKSRDDPADPKGKTWAELMVGASVDERGVVSPLLDFRMLDAAAKAEIFFELIYDVRARRTGVALSQVAVFRVGKQALKAGLEGELFVQGENITASGGPRLVLPFEISGKKFSVAGAYLTKHGEDIARIYAATEW